MSVGPAIERRYQRRVELRGWPEHRFHCGVERLFFPLMVAGIAREANRFDACSKHHAERPTVRSPTVRASRPGGRLVEVLLRIAHGVGRLQALCRDHIRDFQGTVDELGNYECNV